MLEDIYKAGLIIDGSWNRSWTEAIEDKTGVGR